MTIEDGTKLMINLVETNGQCLLLTSLKQQRPNYDMIFNADSDVEYLWTGKKQYTYQKDAFEAIYIGILGGS